MMRVLLCMMRHGSCDFLTLSGLEKEYAFIGHIVKTEITRFGTDTQTRSTTSSNCNVKDMVCYHNDFVFKVYLQILHAITCNSTGPNYLV